MLPILMNFVKGNLKLPVHKSNRFKLFHHSGNIFFSKRSLSTEVEEPVTISLDKAFRSFRLENAPELCATITKDEAECYYRQMQLIRRFESDAGKLYHTKTIRGFCHLYVGQEACCVGQNAALCDNDCVITAYRCHGWGLMLDITPLEMMAELTGRASGNVRGKGGSMHMYGKRFFGGNGIVGAQVPIGVGIALALKYLKKKAVCLALYGDGAANQGQVFEAYNMACLWKLPCIFVCENNMYSMGMSTIRSACNTDYFTRGDYLPGLWVDGMDILAVKNATAFARKHALECGPIVLELNTYRYYGHSMSDSGMSYRSRDEVEETRKARDPITNFKDLCLKHCLLTEEQIKAIDADVKKEINEVSKQATSDKETGLDDLAGDVYFTNHEPCIRGISGYNLQHKNFATRIQYKPRPTPSSKIKQIPKPEPEPTKPPQANEGKVADKNKNEQPAIKNEPKPATPPKTDDQKKPLK